MNGLTDEKFVLDSCVCMNFLNKRIPSLPKVDLFISVITRMEVLAKPDHTSESERDAREFLEKLTVIPIIDAVETSIARLKTTKNNPSKDFRILFPSPSQTTFTQKEAYAFSKIETLIFVCGRYEGIDYRFEEYMTAKYPTAFQKISLGQFVLLGGEVATMTMIEAITRLVPGVIKESTSWQNESYHLKS
jgi:hypothetical protein